MEKIIQVRGLTKNYKGRNVVNKIDFTVTKGSLFSFLGTNGAGKSTTINMICTFTNKTSGEVLIGNGRLKLGEDDTEIKKMIGVVYQQNVMDNQLSVAENLRIRARLYNMKGKEFRKKLNEIADMFEFSSFLGQKFGELSGGQKRRIEIARAIIHEPEILLLDEPTTGLDPKSRKQVWFLIDKLQKEKGTTIFLTTHYLEEAMSSDDIAIISNGNIIARGTAHELQTQYSSDRLFLYAFPGKMNLLEQEMTVNKIGFETESDYVKVSLKDQSDVKRILALAESRYESFELIKGSLEDAFIRVLESNEVGVS